ERVDLRATGCRERIVSARATVRLLVQPEHGPLAPVAADLGTAGVLLRHDVQQLGAEGRQRGVVEGFRPLPARHADARVVDHLPPFECSGTTEKNGPWGPVFRWRRGRDYRRGPAAALSSPGCYATGLRLEPEGPLHLPALCANKNGAWGP